jgi:hypothetical protein
MVGSQSAAVNLAGLTIDPARNDRSCVHVQTNTRTLNHELGPPTSVALPARTTLTGNPRSHVRQAPAASPHTV